MLQICKITFDRIFQPHGEAVADTVIVGANPHMVDTGYLNDVIEVIKNLIKIRKWETPMSFVIGCVEFLVDLSRFLQPIAGYVLFIGIGAGRHEFLRLFGDKWRTKIDHDDAVVFGERLNHVVRHIAFKSGRKVAGRRMRGNDGSGRDLYNIEKGFVGDVTDIHHDAQSVHFADH